MRLEIERNMSHFVSMKGEGSAQGDDERESLSKGKKKKPLIVEEIKEEIKI
jgi:hypothetical protein